MVVHFKDSKTCIFFKYSSFSRPFIVSSIRLPVGPFLRDHDYCIRIVQDNELNDPELRKTGSLKPHQALQAAPSVILTSHPGGDPLSTGENHFTKKFSKCDMCRRSRTKVLVPTTLLSITHGKDDGVTCDFCGAVMKQVQPQTLPDVFEGKLLEATGNVQTQFFNRSIS